MDWKQSSPRRRKMATPVRWNGRTDWQCSPTAARLTPRARRTTGSGGLLRCSTQQLPQDASNHRQSHSRNQTSAV